MIELREVTKSFAGTPAIAALSLVIERGEFVALIGPSGSGKSTTLKMINRLIDPDAGQIFFNGVDTRTLRVEALRRRMGYAIQSTGLFPHWTVARNIATVPQLLGWSAARTSQRVDELLALLGLDAAQFRHRFPHQLSGGQQQRVGVARALAADPDVLLMDEPFGALDPVTRQALQAEMARIHRASNKTIVMVTHDIDEALRLGTRVVLMDRGRIVQDGTPRQLLSEPANDFVIDFLGRNAMGLKLLALHTVADRMRPAAQTDSRRAVASLGPPEPTAVQQEPTSVRPEPSPVRSAPTANRPKPAPDRPEPASDRAEHASDRAEPNPVRAELVEAPAAAHHAATCLPPTMNLRDAMSVLVASHADQLPVVDAHAQVVGTLYYADLLRTESTAP